MSRLGVWLLLLLFCLSSGRCDDAADSGTQEEQENSSGDAVSTSDEPHEQGDEHR